MSKRISPRSQLGRQYLPKRLPEDVAPSKYGNRAQRRAWERLYGPIPKPGEVEADDAQA